MQNADHKGQYLPEKTECFYQTHPAQGARVSMVATPLGNLGDLSQRVVETLFGVDELWCEDTRHTQNLLQAIRKHPHFQTLLGSHRSTPVFRRLDQHTEVSQMRKWLETVQERRQWIGVVTDAGTPGVSDPGGELTRIISQCPQIRLEPIPGPSAVATLVSVAGFERASFVFHGFFPREKNEAFQLLSQLEISGVSSNWIFFESPQRILDTLQILEEWTQGLQAQASDSSGEPEFLLAKELTKIHETLFRGKGLSFFQRFKATHCDLRGEWCFAVILPKSYLKPKKTESDWELALECLIQAKIGPKEASALVVQRFSVAKNLAYRTAVEFQKKLQKK